MSFCFNTPFPGFAGTSPASGGRGRSPQAQRHSSPVYGGGVRKADGGGIQQKQTIAKACSKILFLFSSISLASCNSGQDWDEIRRVCNNALSAAKGSDWFPIELRDRPISLYEFDNRRCGFFFGEKPEIRTGGFDITISRDCFETVVEGEGCKIESATYTDFSLETEPRMCSTTLFGNPASLSDVLGYEVENCPNDFSRYQYQSNNPASQVNFEETE